MDKNTIVFGKNLKEIRKKSNFSRSQLAQKISYSEKAIEKWEAGSSLPPVTTICKLANLFGVTVDSLLFTAKTEVRYLLGIDGGATKTEFKLVEAYGENREIAHCILGSSNPVDIGMENTKKILDQGIRQVCAGINMRQVSAFAGLSGGTLGDNKEILNEFLSHFDFAYFANGNDSLNVLEFGLSGENGVVVTMGTGIIAYCCFDGRYHRIAGWGPHIDKGGSGYNLGSDALDCALKYLDGRGGSKIIKELLEERLKKSIPDSVSEIYRMGKSYVASFAPVVFEAYDMGDEYASEIIENNVKEVVKVINAGLDFIQNKKGKVLLCGGIVNQSEILKPFFRKHMESIENIIFTTERPVNGAVMVAEKLINKER